MAAMGLEISNRCSNMCVPTCYSNMEDKLRFLRRQAVVYLKRQGYGQLSLDQVKQLQKNLGIFNDQGYPSSDVEPYASLPSEAPSKINYIKYLKEKGFGYASLDDVKELQASLGIFSLNPNSHDGRASQSLKGEPEEEKGLELVKDITDGVLGDLTPCEYGRLVSAKRSGSMLSKSGPPTSRVEHGVFVSRTNWIKTSNSKLGVVNYSKKFQSSIHGRPVWILDACFVIGLLQEPRNEDERVESEAMAKTFQQMQAQHAELIRPEVCVVEASYMLQKMGLERRLLDVIVGGVFNISSMENAEWKLVQELLDIYGSRYNVSMADCCLTTIAEALKIVNVATTDYRHLQRLIKPKHCAIFNILP